jgi:DNA polymerase-3 subunit epsilon
MKLYFFDTETTGLIDKNPDAEVTEIAIALWEDGAVKELYDRPFLPKHGCPEEVARINGYSEQLWKEAGAKPFSNEDASELQALLMGVYLAGSNPDFDKRMIAAECQRVGRQAPAWSHRSLNTASLAWPLWALGEVESTGLVSLTKHFGIEHQAHSAMGDVRAAIKVWEALFDLFVHRPKVYREALLAIAGDEKTDPELREFAKISAEGGVL